MEYKTVYGVVGQVDQELNILVKDGWVVQSMCSPGMSIEQDASGAYETPFMVYLLCKVNTVENTESLTKIPERRFIGRKP